MLRIWEKRILTTADFGRIADAPSPEEALRQLGAASEYDFSSLAFPQQYERVLRPAQEALFARCRELCPEPEPVDTVACRYLFHNLKTALKAKLTGAADEGVYSAVSVSDFSAEQLREAVFGEGTLPDYLAGAADRAREAYGESHNPQSVDLAVDRACFARQIALAERIGCAFIVDYFRRAADYYNLCATLRAKDMQQSSGFLAKALAEGGTLPPSWFLEQFPKSVTAMGQVFFFRPFGKLTQKGLEAYQRSGNFAALERLLDNDLMGLVRQSKLFAFGPETVFCYLLAKENELRQIRIVMAGKVNLLPPERLAERLRENYV